MIVQSKLVILISDNIMHEKGIWWHELTSLQDKVEAEKKYSLAAWITRFSAFSADKETALVPPR
jgi:hypothetical protein